MHLGVVKYLAGMDVMTIVIANIDKLHVSCDDSSCDVTRCALIVAMDRERRCGCAMYI